jgi:Conserved region of Rad21 / Rec8 like protein
LAIADSSRNISDGGGGSITDNEFPADKGGDFFNDDDDVMVDDEDDESAARRRRQSLRLSFSGEDRSRASEVGISFGDDSEHNTSATNPPASHTAADVSDTSPPTKKKRKKSSSANNQRKKRRRRTEIDDGHSEVPNDSIRKMLQDTSDVLGGTVHPATWVPGQDEESTETDVLLLFENLPLDRLICRPTMADDGKTAPQLLGQWARNCAPVLDLPFQYDLVDEIGESVAVDANAAPANEAGDEDDESDESVEQLRGAKAQIDETVNSDDEFPQHDGGDVPFDETNKEDEMQVQDVDDDDRMPPDEDHEFPAPSSTLSIWHAHDEIFALSNHTHCFSFLGPVGGSDHSVLSLGATNGLDDVDFGNEADGDVDETTTTTSKYHKNTLKVFDILKQNLAPTDGTVAKSEVSYNELSEGVSRRTAAGLFFELLLLKTLNYIELDQDTAYGDIQVTRGVKFMEDLPST